MKTTLALLIALCLGPLVVAAQQQVIAPYHDFGELPGVTSTGGDTIHIAADLELSNALILGGTRSALKTSNSSVHPHTIKLTDCAIQSFDPNYPDQEVGPNGTKWGMRLYSVANLHFKNVRTTGIFGKSYGHAEMSALMTSAEGHPLYINFAPQRDGDGLLWEDCDFIDCGGNVQFASAYGLREHEGLAPSSPRVKASIRFVRCEFVDLSRGTSRGSAAVTLYGQTFPVTFEQCRFTSRKILYGHSPDQKYRGRGAIKTRRYDAPGRMPKLTLQGCYVHLGEPTDRATMGLFDVNEVELARSEIWGRIVVDEHTLVVVSGCVGDATVWRGEDAPQLIGSIPGTWRSAPSRDL